MKRYKWQQVKGFTLIELMITVAIVAILAAIAMPAYKNYTVRAQVTEGLLASAAVKEDISSGFYTNGADGVVAVANIITLNNGLDAYDSKFISGLVVNNDGEITITFGNNADQSIVNQTIQLNPFATLPSAGTLLSDVNAAGKVDWACESVTDVVATTRGLGAGTNGTLLAQFAPAECK